MRVKFAFILDCIIILAALLSIFYLIFIGEWSTIFFISCLILGLNSIISISKEVKEGFK
ncbi:hypothetical protein IHV12_21280 [Fictibacillus sp. 7GRE50]|uniref:hypothetical protein n=1 Tax=unclassified Fictibacillus TaxID=2644029 RepID=UPI0018CFADF2|nr:MULTISPECIES: hypothetical protein [unclassified Fictibacillus]MBH0163085.1 hypothetical protein [Fictibacillus sp. 26RED30]MBH0167456.1 hypothetical protein [Fictibacillus sp. 7GRE50]